MTHEPKSEWARYAYGYSNKKPTFHGTWLPLIMLVVLTILWRMS